MAPLVSDKARLRREVLSRRDVITTDIKRIKDAAIKKQLFALPEFNNARSVLFYASFKSEVDTLALLPESLAHGKRVALPKVDRASGTLILFEIKTMEELVPGYLGIPEPNLPEARIIDITDIDLVIVPGVAFDGQGNRLGYGKGFYDKLLSHTQVRTVALAYEEQVLNRIPAEAHDRTMDIIITDKRILYINGREKD
ncbi:MAG: 5-formyltetrahydrofolate cyclo-ligase [Nitrospirota bacterium]